MKSIAIAAILALAMLATAQTRSLKQGDVLSRSARIEKAVYRLPSEGDETGRGAISITGNDLTVDFNGATLMGTPESTEPDQRAGIGVEVHGRNITIKNLRVRGYKVGLIARNSPGLKILDSDFSYNWKQHLASTLEREDESDWMSYHHNEKDEWLRYGAGIYLRGCNDFEVKGNTSNGGQCALMLTDCNHGLALNNDFSFNSGLGLGMYRSSDNRILNNKFDWCVRGFSYGVYNRGQDSAGILVFEQCNRNVFAYNSATHGGDGFFLWAGQITMDTGKGGCNDNLLYANDFSHSPANGIEATFSRNSFVNNLLLECWHGIWGGYSFNSKTVGNVFGYNAEAIAWEHGQDNLVDNNRFYRDDVGINLWSNASQDPNWGYGKVRDTKSRDWTISNNLIENERTVAFRIRRSQDITINDNVIRNCGKAFDIGADVVRLVAHANSGTAPAAEPMLNEAFKIDPKFAPMSPASALNQGEIGSPADYLRRFESVSWKPYITNRGGDTSKPGEMARLAASTPFYVKPLPGAKNAFLKPGTLRGWRYILVDEWGPYDFKRPIIWPRETRTQTVEEAGRTPASSRLTVRQFEILGPPGNWRVVRLEGVGSISKSSGRVPDMVNITLPAGQAANVKIELEYVGEVTTDYKGNIALAGQRVPFGYSRFFAPVDWDLKWYAWDSKAVPSPRDKMPAPAQLRLGQPLKSEKTDRLDYAWGGSPGAPVPADHFITLANGTFTVPAGEYTIELTTDDGARLWLDDKLLIDQWHYQGPTLYTASVHLDASVHKIRVEHYEIDGYSALKVNLRPKK